MTECLIEKTKRRRVKGTGPSRSKLQTFVDLGMVDQNIIKHLNFIADKYKENDIGSYKYAISGHCNYEEVFNVQDKYRQILLQTTSDSNSVDEFTYDNWIIDPIQLPMFNNIYRFRISEMKPNHTFKWHIDADTSVMCRAIINLNDNDSIFQFKDKQRVHTLLTKPGHMYFINTGWLHQVQTYNIMRRAALFSFRYEDYIGKTNLNV